MITDESECEFGIGFVEIYVAYWAKMRQDDANYLSTGEENTGLAKEGKMKRSPFYVESDRKTWFLSLGLVKHCETAITNEIARSSTPTLT